jgi:hypothetical protein
MTLSIEGYVVIRRILLHAQAVIRVVGVTGTLIMRILIVILSTSYIIHERASGLTIDICDCDGLLDRDDKAYGVV